MTEAEEVQTDSENSEEERSRLPLFIAAAILGLLAMCVLLGVIFSWEPVRGLRPFRSQPDGVELIIDGEPQLVTFAELSDNAADFQDKRIRVTGLYLPLQVPDCSLFNGPLIQWALISEGLQLNAKGFELPLSIVSPGTTLTVEGIWRLYNGPAGCGKEPETKNVWYLQVERIIQPNPLVAGTVDPQALLLSDVVTPIFPTRVPTRVRATTAGATATMSPTPSATAPITVTGTAVLQTATATATIDLTQTATNTPDFAGTATPSVTPDGSATATFTPTGTITPGTATATPTSGSNLPTIPALTPYPGPGTLPPPSSTPTPGTGY